MATLTNVKYQKLAKLFAGRPAIPEYSVVSGAGTTTNIAVNAGDTTAIAVKDVLGAVLRFTSGTTLASDLIGETSITSAGNIQLTTTNTTGDKLLVIWYRKRG